MEHIDVIGFLPEPKKTAAGEPRQGRFTCHDVQWTGQNEDLFATFTITAEEIADAAENQLTWTDQDVQKESGSGLMPVPPRELPVGDGYRTLNFMYLMHRTQTTSRRSSCAARRVYILALLCGTFGQGPSKPFVICRTRNYLSMQASFLFQIYIIDNKQYSKLFVLIASSRSAYRTFLCLNSLKLSCIF